MVGTARCAVRVPRCNVEWPFADPATAGRRPYQFFPITLKICIHSSRHPRTKNHARVFKILGMTRGSNARLQHLAPLRLVFEHDLAQQANREHPVLEQFIVELFQGKIFTLLHFVIVAQLENLELA